MARKAATRASYSLTAVDSLTRPPAHPSTRSRRLRLKLDELEPRVAPSSLLYHLPILGAMADGSWLMVDEDDAIDHAPPPTRPFAHTPTLSDELSHDWTRMNPPGRTPWRADSADSGTDTSSTIPSDEFTPVTPSQIHRPDGELQRQNSRFQVDSNPQIPIPQAPVADRFEVWSGAGGLELPDTRAASDGLFLGSWHDGPTLSAVPYRLTGSPAYSLTGHDDEPSVDSAFPTSRQVSDFFDPVD